LANHRQRIATVASPAPRKIALIMNSIRIVPLPPSRTRAYVVPSTRTSGPAPMNTSTSGAKTAPSTPSGTEPSTPRSTACTATDAAPSGFFSPIRRATVAVAAMASPIDSANNIGITPSTRPMVAIAVSPRRLTQKPLTTANTDSSASSRTIGTASSSKERPTGPLV
jgi:hypothetical protein